MQKYSVTVFEDGSVNVVDDTAKESVISTFREPMPRQTPRAFRMEQVSLACGALLRREAERS